MTRALENLQNLHFNRLLLTTEELYLMALNIDAKFEGKLTCAFENEIFTRALESLKIGTLMGSF